MQISYTYLLYDSMNCLGFTHPLVCMKKKDQNSRLSGKQLIFVWDSLAPNWLWAKSKQHGFKLCHHSLGFKDNVCLGVFLSVKEQVIFISTFKTITITIEVWVFSDILLICSLRVIHQYLLSKVTLSKHREFESLVIILKCYSVYFICESKRVLPWT